MDLSNSLLTWVTFAPLLGVLVILFIPKDRLNAIRWAALLASALTFMLSLVVLAQFDSASGSLQLVERRPWFQLGGVGIEYFLGVDGLSLLLVLLTTLLTPISILSTWSAIEERVKETISEISKIRRKFPNKESIIRLL